ncbi:MAG: right-handed parallel beta-helix repeat-containing protein [Verrucomicrobia bacterium]|nr:right-handed parallel beta-helix repeat-containing protein [Verrucomicrobiota bacterium]
MTPPPSRLLLTLALLASTAPACSAAQAAADFSPKADERQVPKKMHSAMKELPRITVGHTSTDIIGADNRALQAAVDYVAGLGGGSVEIGPGEYLMRDSLHLRSFVTVRGTPGKTILRKVDGAVSLLALDGDFGEEQITVVDASGFAVGGGVAIWDANAGGFHTTVARLTGRNGNTFAIDHPLNADCMVSSSAKAATVFPVVSGGDIEGARIEHLIIDGNKDRNVHLNGCRGAGIYLYRGFGTEIRDCTVRNFNGDGISFQQSNDVLVERCTSEGNTSLGLHPGSGSQRPTVRACVARHNGEDGLFLCWRVRHGVFEENLLEANGRFGISIGHKDSDNLLRRNQVRLNEEAGVCFRNESVGMAGHRNRLEENVIENNGVKKEAPGIRVRGETKDLQFTGNVIRDTRSEGERKQKVGVLIEEAAGAVALDNNTIDAKTKIDDRRKGTR